MSTPHNQLTGSDLHEPKGVAAATAGQVYVANGAGSGAWTSPAAAGSTVVKKTSSETRSSNTTLAADSALFFPVSANKIYQIRGFINFAVYAAPDFKYRWSGPGTVDFLRASEILIDGSGGMTSVLRVPTTLPNPSTGKIITVTVDDVYMLNFTATLDTAGSGGTFAFDWAQNTSNAAATAVYAGSWLEYRDIS